MRITNESDAEPEEEPEDTSNQYNPWEDPSWFPCPSCEMQMNATVRAPRLDDIALVEFHDARIDRLDLVFERGVVVQFAHLSVFYRVDEARYDVWSCSARLQLLGVCQMAASRLDATDGIVLSGACYGRAGDNVDPTSLLSGQHASRIVLEMSGGAVLEFEFADARLEAVVPLEKVEEWSGPLVTE